MERKKHVLRPNSPAVDFSLLDNLDKEPANIALKIEKSIMYICHLKEPSIIMIDKKALNAIQFLRLYSQNQEYEKEFQIIFKYESIIQIFSNIISYYYNELKALIKKPDVFNDANNAQGIEALYHSQYNFMFYLLGFCCSMTSSFKTFCLKFHDFNGTKSLFNYLTDDEFMDCKIAENAKKLIEMIRIINDIVFNLSSLVDSRRKSFDELKVVTVMLKLLEVYKNDKGITTACYLTLANTVNEDEINTLPNIKSAIQSIAKLVGECANLISSNIQIKRTVVVVDTDDGTQFSAQYCKCPDGWHIYELINGLSRLAVSDQIKFQMYEEFNLKDHLEKIIMSGNEHEKACAMKLLWQLCFDQEVAKKLNSSSKLYDYVDELSRTATNEDLKKYSAGILWSIEKIKGLQRETALSSLHSLRFKQTRMFPQNHIMISYNCESRKLCLEIKKELEKQNYVVWIDVENIHGSSLESMANAVEESICVLVCMTEKYKQSPNCRAEAEYAFKLNKPIIPLVMQQDFTPDGWLGILVGSKIYVNFTKYSFEEAIKRLLGEIGSNDDEDEDEYADEAKMQTTKITPIRSDKKYGSVINLEVWSKEEVCNWLKNSNVDNRISEILKDFNGKKLIRLKSIWNEAPDYFYQTISQNNKIDLLAVIVFLEEFEKLFF